MRSKFQAQRARALARVLESESLAGESAVVVGPALAILSVALVVLVELIRQYGTALLTWRP